MGEITQLLFGAIAPGNVTANLMTANVTGGAASQCAELLHDLKAGLIVGTSARALTVAQVLGVVAGSLAGSAAYLTLLPDPAHQLFTPAWPAPAVATWKAVAELLQHGLHTLPPGATVAAPYAGALLGVGLTIAEKRASASAKVWIPSAASLAARLRDAPAADSICTSSSAPPRQR